MRLLQRAALGGLPAGSPARLLASLASRAAREFSRAATRPAGEPARPPQRALVLARAASSKAKPKTLYVCSGCGEETSQWSGQCKSCGAWNTLEKVSVSTAAEAGGGSGARAAARFAAGRTVTAPASRAGRGSASSDEGSVPALGSARSARRSAWVQETEAPQRLVDISRRGFRQRWRLQLPGENGQELARVLGGGVVPGSLTLVGGEPGVGKSTLLLQMAAMLTEASLLEPGYSGSSGSSKDAKGSAGAAAAAAAASGKGGGKRKQDVQQPAAAGEQQEAEADAAAAAAASDEEDGSSVGDAPGGGLTVLYVSAEESVEQVGSRAERMGIARNPSIYIYSANRLDSILDEIIRLQPGAVIVDSIQTVYLDEVSSSQGSVTQVRECATALLQVAKRERLPVFLVGHVTKSGDLAGPRVLEHIVDAVVHMEGGRQQPVRLVRCMKNRYGSTDEVGVFEMHDDGMQVVANPSSLFLSDRDLSPNVSSAVAVVLEGTRPLLMEVQALCSPVPQGSGQPPTRFPSGVKRDRLALLLAVLGKHTEIRPYSVDVHLNVTGGLEMSEPATDLAVVCAIASSYFEQPIGRDVCMIGEVGLGGELRPVGNIERRVAEALKLGFKRFVVPASSNIHPSPRIAGASIVECRTVLEAFRAVLGTGGRGRQQ